MSKTTHWTPTACGLSVGCPTTPWTPTARGLSLGWPKPRIGRQPRAVYRLGVQPRIGRPPLAVYRLDVQNHALDAHRLRSIGWVSNVNVPAEAGVQASARMARRFLPGSRPTPGRQCL